jgi:hypothetical protein
MQMKETICLTGLLVGWIMGASLPPRIKACTEQWKLPSSPSIKKLEVLGYANRGETYAWRVLGFSGSVVSSFSEAWWKCEFCTVLWSSVEALGCSSQKTSRPTGKRGTALSRQYQTPYRPSNPGENWRTAVGPSSPDLARSDFHLFGPLQNPLGGKRFADDGGAQVDETRVIRHLCCAFRRTSKATLVEDTSRNIYISFQIRVSCFTSLSICDLFTDSLSHNMAPEPISTAYFINLSHWYVSLYVNPHIVARQQYGKTLPLQRTRTQQKKNCWRRRFPCGPCRSKGKYANSSSQNSLFT